MLQGHDPLIIENNKKREADSVWKLLRAPPVSQLTLNTKRNAAFKAQSSTNKEENKWGGGFKKAERRCSGRFLSVSVHCCLTASPAELKHTS